MKKIILFVCSILFITGCSNITNYNLEIPKDLYLNQDNYFDAYEDVVVKGASIKDVSIIGLELLGLTEETKGRITEFGSFTLRYCLIIEEELIHQEYRTIYVTYEKMSDGLIYNSDFLAGTLDWGFVDWKNSLDIKQENDMLKITQNSVDEYIWDQSFYQYINDENNHLEINKNYILTFDAKTTNDKTIKVCLAQVLSDSPYSYNVTEEKDIEINNSLKTYTIEFTTTYPNNIVDKYEFNIKEVRLEFKFGKYNDKNIEKSTMYFDNISIKSK